MWVELMPSHKSVVTHKHTARATHPGNHYMLMKEILEKYHMLACSHYHRNTKSVQIHMHSQQPQQPHKHSTLPPGWITGWLIMQAADLWCNLVQGGRASHTKRQKDQRRPLVSCSARQQTLSTTRKRTELEWTKQVNNELWTDLIRYLVRMMMVVVAMFESNYPIITNNRDSGDGNCFIHLETQWITWQSSMWSFLYKVDIFCLNAGIFARNKLWCLLCGTTTSEGKSVPKGHTQSWEKSWHHGIQITANSFSQIFPLRRSWCCSRGGSAHKKWWQWLYEYIF